MAKKKMKNIKRMTSITPPPLNKTTNVSSVTPTPAITITKTLGLCPICKATSAFVSRYMTGDILLYGNETAHAYDVIQVEEMSSPRKYYKDGVEYSGHRIIVTCVCSKCESTWTEDYDTSIPTDVYNIVDNSKRDISDTHAIDLLAGYENDTIGVRDDTDDDDLLRGGRHWVSSAKKDKPPLPPFVADPTPLYYETSITKTLKSKNTSKGDKK